VRRQSTVLFSDLRGFTSFAETIDPDQVVEILNFYLDEMSEAIMAHGGTLVTYMGDGIMAVFGAPVDREDHAQRALAAARDSGALSTSWSVARSATLVSVEEHGGSESSVEVELRGLSIYTHHGVSDAEQEVGQRLEFDLSLDLPDCDAVLTDRVEDTVDYDIVALAATERSYRTLERLCQVVAERLIERFDCESVRVRAAKPEPPVSYPVQEAGVEVTLERSIARELDDEEGV
jgi:dihydroneopterin aldolase